MDLLEFEGKELFRTYGIPVPSGTVISQGVRVCPLPFPVVMKSQVPVGDRRRKGGIVVVTSPRAYAREAAALWKRAIDGHLPERLLLESRVTSVAERYVSFTYDTATRTPVLALCPRGGTGIDHATLTSVDPLWGLPSFLIRRALAAANMKPSRAYEAVIAALWRLFTEEQATLAEINPLFERADGSLIAGDAKVTLDDNAVRPDWRPYVHLGGDIAILASGGGASMINLDALLHVGGRPANYVEYSGNPKGDVVNKLTQQVLGMPGLRGCWVVGGTANFTDIYETMRGFVEGLRHVKPKPTYPIVIRRDGPRREEAFAMLKKVGAQEGFNIHLYGPETSMTESANILMKLAYGATTKKPKKSRRAQ